MSRDHKSMMMVGRVGTGYVIVLVGRGTSRESAALAQFAQEAFLHENCSVTVDLSGCDHLDSTFLGCLATLHKQHAAGQSSRLRVVASPDKVQQLLAPCKLDKLLETTSESAPITDTLMVVSEAKLDQMQMGRHIMECHRILAELGGPNAPAFAAVADLLEQELTKSAQP